MEGFGFVISTTGLNRSNTAMDTDKKIFKVEAFLIQWFLHFSHIYAGISYYQIKLHFQTMYFYIISAYI
jgi:hypothetical protein